MVFIVLIKEINLNLIHAERKKKHLMAFSNKSGKKYPVSTRRRFDVHTTSIMLKRRRTDFKTTSCMIKKELSY